MLGAWPGAAVQEVYHDIECDFGCLELALERGRAVLQEA